MSDIFLEREFDPRITSAEVWNMVREIGHCFQLNGGVISTAPIANRSVSHYVSPDRKWGRFGTVQYTRT